MGLDSIVSVSLAAADCSASYVISLSENQHPSISRTFHPEDHFQLITSSQLSTAPAWGCYGNAGLRKCRLPPLSSVFLVSVIDSSSLITDGQEARSEELVLPPIKSDEGQYH